ncbi:protein MEI2-like 4 isoform X1 [Phoenix dactylifera]|uniref:Protein MEI2-like 4 isoform X1 n=1 Tax=Phoenix dactylifera TaxID=42345 RepID=A0A8B7D358_PHODC|nr:protein MEI2-like 4 isoform X1 [Phoenix dactylifera]
MPSEVMDQRSLSSICLPSGPLSFFSDEFRLPAQRQVGFWKKESVPDHRVSEGLCLMSGSKINSSFLLEKLCSVGGDSLECLELTHPYFFEDEKTKISLEHHLMGTERTASLSMSSCSTADRDESQLSLSAKPASLFMEGNKVDLNGVHLENSLFSSSLLELCDKKSRLSTDDVCVSQHVDKSNSNIGKDEPFESSEGIESQTIGNLLPDDDDLLSGVIDDLEYIAQPRSGDDTEDDLFCSGGGMELEADDRFSYKKASNSVGEGASDGQLWEPSRLFANEQPFGEHPSRILIVRNFNSIVDDTELRVLFEQFGDIHMLYTGCKYLGFVMVSYYDIRAAQKAKRALQNRPFRHCKLDIHFTVPKDNPLVKDTNEGTLILFNLDSSVSNDDLCQIFGVYGDIKEICEMPQNLQKKFIDFYDVRAAEAAFHALNGSSIVGKKMKLESRSTGAAQWCLMQQPSLELEQEESCRSKQGIHPSNSPSNSYGTIPLVATASIGLDNGSTQDLNSSVRAPIHPSAGSTFPRISSIVPHSLSSPVGIASASSHSNQSGHERRHSLGQMNIGSQSSQCTQSGHERCHSLGQMNFSSQIMANFHLHSLPEHHNGKISSIPYSSSSATSTMTLNINSRPADVIDGRSIQRSGLGGFNSHSFGHIGGDLGISGDRSFALHGHQFLWNDSNQYNHRPLGPIFWPDTPSYLNNFPALPSPQKMNGLPRAPPRMLNAPLPLHHHVGSAPAMNPSLWDRRQTFRGDYLEACALHPASLGSLGLAAGSALHPLELASHNIFPHTSGNCMDPSISSAHVMPSPEQRSRMFHLRNTMLRLPLSYDAPNDRIRSRRSDAGSSQTDNKKQFELDIDLIMHGEDSRTTLMIKNIPNKYTSKMLLATIDEHHRGTYDFIYLPIDFKNKCNVGYAFINMTSAQHIIPFFQTFNGKKWEKFNSEKVASLAYARIQGRAALIAHFQNSSLMNEDKRCRPILFHSDGPNAGEQEPFPMGVNIRSRTGRSKTVGSGENHLASPSTSSNGEESSDASDSSSACTKESD